VRQISLAEICTFAGGGKLKLTKSDYVKEGYPAFSAAGHDGFVSQYEFERLAIVVSAIGARCGKAFLAEGRWASLANTYCVFPNVTKVDPTFLWYQLNDENSWVKSGSAQPFIKPSDIKRRVVSFPTLEEQRRIAKLLDRAAEIRRRAEAARAKARSIIPALFLDTFGDPATNPMGWPVVKLGEVISEGPQNGLYRPASDYGRELEFSGLIVLTVAR
jgi:type I restriction enzyme S subunit